MEIYKTPAVFGIIILIFGFAVSAVLYFVYLKNRHISILKVASIVIISITVYATAGSFLDYIKISDNFLYVRNFSKFKIYTIRLSDVVGMEVRIKLDKYLLRRGSVKYKRRTLIIYMTDGMVSLPENIFTGNSFNDVVTNLQKKGIKKIN